MNYLYKNKVEDVYLADIGKISKIIDVNSKYKNKLIYESGGTDNGYCYIPECSFDYDTLFVDYVNENKDKLIEEGGLSTANSIKEEIRNYLEYEEYYYRYQKKDIFYTIKAKDFDDELINIIASEVFEAVDWEATQTYISDVDWEEEIKSYYDEKIKGDELEI